MFCIYFIHIYANFCLFIGYIDLLIGGAGACPSSGVEVRGQSVQFSSLLLPCVTQGLDSSHQGRQQVPLLTEPSCQFCTLYYHTSKNAVDEHISWKGGKITESQICQVEPACNW